MTLLDHATKHVRDIVTEALLHVPPAKTLVVVDLDSPLSRLLAEAYRAALPQATFLVFGERSKEEIFVAFDGLAPGDLVVLVQSMSFRLDEFRIRIELFKRKLKVIEHVHLSRMAPDQEAAYVAGLAHDPNAYRPLGHALKTVLDSAKDVLVECAGTKLVYATAMEPAKLNVGDYAGMENIGGTFPIGEVFTEAKDFAAVNGDALVFAYAKEDYFVQLVEPFRVSVAQGLLSAPEAPAEFQAVLAKIQADEGDVLVREFGLGLNPAFGKARLVNDITAFERQRGVHLSLGAKHTVYSKPGVSKKQSRYHVDIFLDVTRVLADGKPIYQDGDFCVT
jgi:hypothetical protein